MLFKWFSLLNLSVYVVISSKRTGKLGFRYFECSIKCLRPSHERDLRESYSFQMAFEGMGLENAHTASVERWKVAFKDEAPCTLWSREGQRKSSVAAQREPYLRVK